MTEIRYKSTAVMRRYISKSNSSNVKALEVTEENCPRVRVLWRVPDAKPGDFVVKANAVYVVVGAIDFNARYRSPR